MIIYVCIHPHIYMWIRTRNGMLLLLLLLDIFYSFSLSWLVACLSFALLCSYFNIYICFFVEPWNNSFFSIRSIFLDEMPFENCKLWWDFGVSFRIVSYCVKNSIKFIVTLVYWRCICNANGDTYSLNTHADTFKIRQIVKALEYEIMLFRW